MLRRGTIRRPERVKIWKDLLINPSDQNKLHALDHLVRTMGGAVAIVSTDPRVELNWLEPGPLKTRFDGEPPSVSVLFSSAQGNHQRKLADFWADMEQNETATTQLQLTQPNGESNWYRFHSMRGTFDDGSPYLMLSLIDIEQLLQGEKQRIESRRTEAIQNMASGIAHEFNNNLTPIRGFIELTLDCMDQDDFSRDGLATALKQVEACADLVKQIMFTSSKSILNLRKVSPSTLLSNIVYDAIHFLEIPIDTTEVVQEIQPDLPAIWIDHDVFRDAIRHLLHNAMTAMPQGGTLRVSANQADDYVRISIQDTGVGINPRNLEKVFDPFFTTRNRAEARGMGLPMVQGMVSQMGGWTQIDSVPDRGTTITIYLPLKSKAESEEEQAGSRGSGHSVASPLGPAGRMLVADDEDYILKLITRVFSKEGWEIVEGSSFYEVLNVMEHQREEFDVLILDISMPGPSAEETLERIRNSGFDKPIIMVSGLPNSDRIKSMIETYNCAFISKPFSLGSILDRVETLMAESK